MDSIRILITGDYRHRDFQDLIRENHNCTTLIPMERILSSPGKFSPFEVVTIAQSRRNQFDRRWIEQLQESFSHVPLIALLGSWCEGELRSGAPAPGLIRMYWHQWQGQLNTFLHQLEQNQVATWNLPRTYSLADRVTNDLHALPAAHEHLPNVGISALSPNSYGMLKDVCDSANLTSFWVESCGWGENEVRTSVILVDGNSVTSHFVERVRNIRNMFPESRMIATLNFPRQYDHDVAIREGVDQIFSKPFNLADLHLQLAGLSDNAA